jgi:hypothetical protein
MELRGNSCCLLFQQYGFHSVPMKLQKPLSGRLETNLDHVTARPMPARHIA